MSAEQLSAFLETVKEDAVLQQKLKAAADLDAAVAMAKEAGFEVSPADWLKAQANQIMEMSDEELAGVAGGYIVAAHANIGESTLGIRYQLNTSNGLVT
jgi:predicted ribosomally synthesized peptide with nif11-like leader